MGLWSSIKKAAKKVWNAVKGAARVVARVVTEIVHRFVMNIFDTLLGFLNWPEKKLRIKIFILIDEYLKEVVQPDDLKSSIEYAIRVFKKNYNVKLLPYKDKEPIAEILPKVPPKEALNVECDAGAWGEEFGVAGDFFESNLAGLAYPITVYVVKDINGKMGCSIGPVTDYVTLDPEGVKSTSTMAHEIGHSCGHWHSGSKSNLMWRNHDRGDGVKWWQKNIFRGSRHVTYW